MPVPAYTIIQNQRTNRPESESVDQQRIIMNFSAPPSGEDLVVMAQGIFETLPEELLEHCDTLIIEIEEFPDEATEAEMELEDPYELLALYRSGKELSPGVESKVANDDDVLILYRRPILDYWCDSGEDLTNVVREVMIEELGSHFEFSDRDIEEMTARHHQGML